MFLIISMYNITKFTNITKITYTIIKNKIY